MSFIDQRWQHHRQRFSADYDTASHQHHHHHHHHPMASADSSFDTEPDTSIAPPPPSSSTSSSSAASATNATAAKQQPLERSKGDMLYQDLHPDGTPRRPMNAFMIFARHMRKNIQEESPGLKTGEISKRLSDDWKNLDSERKEYFHSLAKTVKDEFHSRFPSYVYKRRPNHQGKRRSKLNRSQRGSSRDSGNGLSDGDSADSMLSSPSQRSMPLSAPTTPSQHISIPPSNPLIAGFSPGNSGSVSISTSPPPSLRFQFPPSFSYPNGSDNTGHNNTPWHPATVPSTPSFGSLYHPSPYNHTYSHPPAHDDGSVGGYLDHYSTSASNNNSSSASRSPVGIGPASLYRDRSGSMPTVCMVSSSRGISSYAPLQSTSFPSSSSSFGIDHHGHSSSPADVINDGGQAAFMRMASTAPHDHAAAAAAAAASLSASPLAISPRSSIHVQHGLKYPSSTSASASASTYASAQQPSSSITNTSSASPSSSFSHQFQVYPQYNDYAAAHHHHPHVSHDSSNPSSDYLNSDYTTTTTSTSSNNTTTANQYNSHSTPDSFDPAAQDVSRYLASTPVNQPSSPSSTTARGIPIPQPYPTDTPPLDHLKNRQ